MVLIEASILSADPMRLGEQIKEAESSGVDGFQIDVMDGHFVPNITFGPDVVKAMRTVSHKMLDVHLMVTDPDRYLDAFAEAGADRMIVHVEARSNAHRVLRAIRKLGIEAGVSLNPGTPVCELEEILDIAQVIQVMTVHPGFGGQDFIYSQLDKIRRIKKMLEDRKLTIPIAVDGGIDTATTPDAVKSGAEILVSGSSIYRGNASIKENIAALRASIQGHTEES
ncbi:MAG: ribulose-phosphate 3-epimerase [Armatimonadota bacterium]